MKTPRLPRLALANVLLGLLAAPAAGQLPAQRPVLERAPGALRRSAARGVVVATDRVLDRNPGAVLDSAAATPVARQLLIRGHVADQDARAVAGGAVVLVGTALSTTTSASGDFTLAVPAAVVGKLPVDVPVRLLLTYPGYAARGVELAPCPVDLAGITQLMVTVGPGAVLVVRTLAKGSPLARVIPPLTVPLTTALPPPSSSPPSPPTSPTSPAVMESLPPVPAFPWPPPHPSAFCVLSGRFTVGVRQLSGIDARLRRALAKARFHDPAYYSIPEGFAMVTRIEQLDGKDDPLPEPNRWAPDEVAGSSLAEFLSRLVRAHTGRFRVVVLAVTARAFAPAADTASKAQAMAWLRYGTAFLPAALGRLPWTADSHCTALVYEFEKKENCAAALVEASRFSGQQHLAKAGIALGP